MNWIIKRLERHSRPVLMLACLVFVALVGFVDYRTGSEISFSVFYLLAVGIATWFVGGKFGLFLSLLCVSVAIAW